MAPVKKQLIFIVSFSSILYLKEK